MDITRYRLDIYRWYFATKLNKIRTHVIVILRHQEGKKDFMSEFMRLHSNIHRCNKNYSLRHTFFFTLHYFSRNEHFSKKKIHHENAAHIT